MKPHDYLTLPMACRELFSPAECAAIRALAGTGRPGLVEREDQSLGVDVTIRKALSHPLPRSERWVSERVLAMLQDINERYYHFRLSELSALRLLEYQPGGFYDWHVDIGLGSYSTRKLSCIVFLSDPADYCGGSLVIGQGSRPLPADLGSAIVFPAYLVHRVEPVSTGQRFTLAGWAHGEAFV